MGVRRLLIASISTGLVVGTGAAFAQDEETNVQNLPPIEISPPPTPATARRDTHRTRVTRGARQTTARRGTPRERVASPTPPLYVYPTAPGEGSSIDVNKIPAAINAVDAN